MKKELLAPAGDMECLKAAVHAGCDAVYLGGKKFGARKYAENFSEEELIQAIEYCHLYGVKIYVTLNTMIYDDEIEDAINYARFLHQNNIDAIIIQDIGLIKILHDKFPNLELHASTQLHNYTTENFKELEKLGVTRIVLARECSLDEINSIKTNLQKEVFIHGAICISYSGQCLFSSLILNRSGNRGECAGMCRLPYKLAVNNQIIETNGKYLLSPKELSTLNKITELMKSDITSFKIEGRMKSKEYVYLITKTYRNLIDKYNNHQDPVLTKETLKNISVTYNREFTEGHLFRNTKNDLMNIKTPNHIGIPLGKVIRISNKKLYIKLEEDLNQGDGIRFKNIDKGMIVNFLYNEDNLLTSTVKKGHIAIIDNKFNISNIGEELLKTTDKQLINDIENYPLKKIPIKIKGIIEKNKNILIEITDDKNTVKITGDIPSLAKNKPTSKREIEEHLTKLGNTPYICSNIELNIDNDLFIPLKSINNIRRQLVDNLTNLRLKRKRDFIENNIEYNYNKVIKNNPKISCLVRTEEQLKKVIELNIDRIYITDEKLYYKYKDKCNLYLRLDRIKKYKEYNNEKLLITEISKFNYLKNNECITDYYLNVSNNYYCKYLIDNNVKTITLSVENNIDQIKKFIDRYNDYFNIEVLVYGRIELMIMKHCIIDQIYNKDSCNNCNLCNYKNYLIDRNNKKYPIISNKDKINHILNYTSNIFSDIEVKELIDNKISSIRIEFLDESPEEVIKIIKKYLLMLQK